MDPSISREESTTAKLNYFLPYVDLDKTKVINNYTIQIALKKAFGLFLYALLRLYKNT
jgi:hypothetical protein